ncbi:MAG: hypothetical protein AAF479_15680 [Pseudomonadota bacterium]
MKYMGIVAITAMLSACGTLEGGSSQGITLNTNAENATCSITQNGVEIVPASPAPATHDVPRRAGNLLVTCSAPGYNSETVALVAGKHPRSVAGVMLTGALINVGTDAYSGGIHEYQNEAYIHLTRSGN